MTRVAAPATAQAGDIFPFPPDPSTREDFLTQAGAV